MNIPPVQPIQTADQPLCLCHDALDCPAEATVAINATELARIAELLGVIDAFLRCGNGAADRLADYLLAAQHSHPTPPDDPCHQRMRAGYDVNLFIDQVGFTAHTLRAHAEGGAR